MDNANTRQLQELNAALEKANEELRAQKEELRLILDTIPAFIWYKDDKNNIMRVNRAGAESVNMAVEDLEGVPTADIFPKEADAYYEDDRKIIDSGVPKLGYIESYSPSAGQKRWIRTDKIPFNTTKNSKAGILVIATDITDTIRSKEALEASERKFRAAMDAAPTGMLIIDDSQTITLINHQIAELFDWTSDELIGQSVRIIIPSYQKIKYNNESSSTPRPTKTPAIENSQSLMGRRKDGSLFAIEIGIGPFTHDNRDFAIASVVDITDRIAAETALRSSEERFQLAVRGASVGIWDWFNVNEEQEWWSPNFYRLLGYEDREIPASLSNFSKLLHPEDTERTFEAVRKTFADDTNFEIEYRLQTKSGEYKWFLGHAILVRDSEGAPLRMVGSIQDINDRRAVELDLTSSNQKLSLANTELSNFAYITSHDLREPLRSISSFMQLLKSDYGNGLDESANEFIDFAIDGAHRLQNMIKSLLLYSRLDTKKLVTKIFSIDSAANLAINELKTLVEETDTDIDLGSTSFSVEGDINQITQVFQNLVANSIKFRQGNSVKIAIDFSRGRGADLHPSLLPDLRYGLVEIKDNGIGIDSSYHKRIFEIFQKLHPESEYQGSGIGLAICSKIIVHHNGAIWVASQVGNGCVFSFALPLAE